MANECMNYITIKGDKDLIQLFADSYLKKEDDGDYSLDFDIIAPIPNNCENDYDFRIQNWGNKWDGTNGEVTFWTDNEIFIDVTTAWNPCEPIVHKLIELCPALYFYHEYYEPGEGYVGWIEHFENDPPDEYINIYYHANYESYEYWVTMFEKEFETFDWLSEHVEWCVDDKIITQEQANHIQSLIEHNTIEEIVDYCLDKEVL